MYRIFLFFGNIYIVAQYFGNEHEHLGLQSDIFFVRNLQNSANELQKFPFEIYRITYVNYVSVAQLFFLLVNLGEGGIWPKGSHVYNKN